MWVVVGWLGRASTALHCMHYVSARRLRDASASFAKFVFVVGDVFARLLCPSPPGIRSEREALHGCRAGIWISLLATRLVVHHLERERFRAKSQVAIRLSSGCFAAV